MASFRLLEDGVSKRLLEDGTSKRLLETPPAVAWSTTAKLPSIILSNSNLTAAGGASATDACVRASAPGAGAKFYCEFDFDALGTQWGGIGVCDEGFDCTSATPFSTVSRMNSRTDAGGSYNDGSFLGSSPNFSAGHVGMIAYDDTANKYYVGIDGVWVDGADPSAGTGGMVLTFAGGSLRYVFAYFRETDQQITANFAGPFTYTVPTGFSAYAAAGSSPTTIAVTAATIAYAAQALTVNAKRAVPVVAAGIAYAGQSISVNVRKTVAVVAAGVAYAGQAITVNAKSAIPVLPAGIAYSGQSVVVNAKRAVAVVAAGIAYAGQSITVTITGGSPTTIAVTAATITYAAQALTVNAKRAVPVVAGSIAYAGQSITVNARKLVQVLPAGINYAGQVMTIVGAPIYKAWRRLSYLLGFRF